jgi:hypothetical protein
MKLNGSGSPSKDGWKGYVNWAPSEEDKKIVKGRVEKKDYSPDRVIESLVESGYAVSFVWDAKSQCIRASVTGKTVPCPNIGYTLSIRGSTVNRIVGLVEFYCQDICQAGDWLVEKLFEEVW